MKTDYKKAYDDLSVNDELHESLLSIPENKKSPHVKSVSFKVAATIAAVFVMLFSADIISYAVTGEGVAERVQKAVSGSEKTAVTRVVLNGKDIEDYIVYYDDNGCTIEYNDPHYGSILVIADGTPENFIIEMIPQLFVREEQDRVFVVVGDEYLKIDITDDIADGSAEGDFEVEDVMYHYSIYADGDDYQYTIDKVK